MLNRQQLLSIINAMSDDGLVQALSAAGVDVGKDQMDLGQEETEGLQSWNERPVAIQDSPREPLVDKSQFTIPKPKPVATRQAFYGGPDMSGLEDYSIQQGDDGNTMGM